MPNSQFTIYTSADSGSVVLNGTSGSLIALLDQCLVSGSASKPGAGWTKPFANSSNFGCWTQGTGSRMTLFINDSAPNTQSVAQIREALATEQEFTVWLDDAPVTDIDESFSNIIPSTVRRRVYIF